MPNNPILAGRSSSGSLRVGRRPGSYDRDGWRRRGRFITCRTRFDLTLVPPPIGNDAWMTYWLHAVMPDIAEQTWSRIVERDVRFVDGELTMRGGIEHRIDIGNYNIGNGGAPTYAFLLKAAREMGDHGVYAGVKQVVDERYPLVYAGDAARHDGMSSLANLLTAIARFSGPDVMRNLIDGHLSGSRRGGPVLARATYPDVQVARATTDGHILDLVLRPGNGVVTTTLGIEGLMPNTAYVAEGTAGGTLHANGSGEAELTIDLRERTHLRITPAGSDERGGAPAS